jgi:hypothetical protein
MDRAIRGVVRKNILALSTSPIGIVLAVFLLDWWLEPRSVIQIIGL